MCKCKIESQMNNRLSSDNLYHFTKDPETIVKIINFGFRYSLCFESIPYRSLSRNLFNISFCDIKFEESETHRKCYGNNSIVLKKEWGISNGVSPVRYVHSNSPGISESYILMRGNYHFLRGLAMKYKKNFEFPLLYLFTSIMEIDKKLNSADVENEIKKNFKEFKLEYNKLDKEFAQFYDGLKLKSPKEAILFTKYIESLIYKITELHNELIKRDNFTRIYEEKFKCPLQKNEENKVLYDEREWRAIYIKEIDENESDQSIPIVDSYLKQGFLPEEYNLQFCESDVVAIIVSDIKAKNIVLENIKDENCLLSRRFIEERIYSIEEFKE